MSGAIAFRKLEVLVEPDNLRQVFANLNSGTAEGERAADITSCFASAVAVAKTLTNQPIVKGVFASMVSGGTVLVRQGQTNVQTSEIMKYLDKGFLVMISLKFKKGGTGGGDHHFAAFALDKKTVVAAMGWQNKYDLTQWFWENEQGKFTRDRFQGLMKQIENGSSDAVAELCAFLGVTRDGRSIPEAIHQEVEGYRPESQAQAFKLPST